MKTIGSMVGAPGGIADSPKLGQAGSFAFGRNLDFRSDPTQLTINPKSVRVDGGVAQDLVMWFDQACSNLYGYGNTGTIYKKDLTDVWSIEQSVPESSGNGLCYFAEDGYLYYAQDTTIGRRSNACGDGIYYNAFIENEGGAPTNSKSITFRRASSQYASIADNASLSITGDLTIESYVKLLTFPDTNEIFVIASKWNENGNQRSYKFDITTTSNYFGDGRDGALTISTNTTEDPVDANCSGTSGTSTLTLTNAHASFASVQTGDKVLIHQTRGTGAGLKQIATVQSYAVGGILNLQEPLSFSPTHSATESAADKAQVRVLKQYTNVVVNTGITYTCKAWNGFKGGIIGWFANGVTTINGTVTGKGKGFRGGVGYQDGLTGPDKKNLPLNIGYYAEGTGGASARASNYIYTANGNGAGASSNGSDILHNCGGSGGGNGAIGLTGQRFTSNGNSGAGGGLSGDANLVTASFGGGGAGGTTHGTGTSEANTPRNGGAGGAYAEIASATFTMGSIGVVNMDGNDGESGAQGLNDACGGGGAGGSVVITSENPSLGSSQITAVGGSGGLKIIDRTDGGNGANGRVAIYYSTTYSGTTAPGATYVLAPNLSNTSGYILRLLVSTNGTNSETYSVNITNLVQLDQWYRWQVTWNSSTGVTTFYQNATQIGQVTGTFHQIYNSTARFALATSYDSSGNPEDYGDFKMDDTRIWNDIRNPGELTIYNDRVLTGVDSNLVAYYKFEDNVNDSQTWTATSNLTATNSPTYSTDVPFSGVTTRRDQDVLIDASGSTYTLGTSLSEAAADRQTFQPTKEPVKSISLNINTVGTGNWTVVVHDGLNREVASLTVANAQLHTGVYEFIFTESFRPILTANYHVHVYSTVGDGKVVTSSLNDMEGTSSPNTGAYLATFFQILVNDVYHPMTQFLNFVVIGNERYVAKLEAGGIYSPHQLVLPAGYRVRSFAVLGEYLAIGVWKGDTITDFDQGKVFIWDGSSDVTGVSSPNTIIPVLQGGVNTMNGDDGTLFAIAGYKGKLLQYSNPQFRKITQMPLLETTKYCEFAPGSMTMWQSVLRFGGTINTDSETIHQGIYSWGSLNVNYPNALSLDYSLSLGDQTTSSVRVGGLFPQGQKLYVGWQNGNSFGIDSVANTNEFADDATIELLISDLGKISQRKNPLVFRVDFKPLLAGQTITLKYKPDRAQDWRILEVEDQVDATQVIGIMNEQMKEVQLACDVITNGQQVTITGITLETENMSAAKGISS